MDLNQVVPMQYGKYKENKKHREGIMRTQRMHMGLSLDMRHFKRVNFGLLFGFKSSGYSYFQQNAFIVPQ